MVNQILIDQCRFLAFQKPSAALAKRANAYLIYGLIVTWLVGIGRYWDNPRAELWQLVGLGSLAYIVLLATLLWLLVLPLSPRNWSWRNVLLFLSLTSLPALLYAIPVERFTTMRNAAEINVWFLAVVASWRVALLLHFLRQVAALPWYAVIIASLLPIVLIIVALFLLNLEHVVFDLMAGLRDEDRSANDEVYWVVFVLTHFALLAAPVLVIGYLFAAYFAWRHRIHTRRLAQTVD